MIKRQKLLKTLGIAFAVCAVMVITVAAQTYEPRSGTVKCVGVVRDASKLSSRVVGMTFSLYEKERDGVPLWVEMQNVRLDSTGHFTVYLGRETAGGIPVEVLAAGEERWLGVQVEGRREQARTRFSTAQSYVYWTNYQNGSVGRAKNDGTSANESFIASTTGKAIGGAGMTVNSQHIYWTSANGGTATTILRANLDGTSVNKSFITGAHNPCGVTVNSSHIYWGGDVGTAIGRANLDGTSVNQNFIATGTGTCGVAVTSTHIYWADYQTNWIGRANLDGTSVNKNFIATNGAGALAIGGNFIYWPNNGTAIGRAKLDGTSVNKSFITGLNGTVAYVAVDSAHIYWTDWGNRGSGSTIGRANLDGSSVNQNFITGALGPFGIAVTAGSPITVVVDSGNE